MQLFTLFEWRCFVYRHREKFNKPLFTMRMGAEEWFSNQRAEIISLWGQTWLRGILVHFLWYRTGSQMLSFNGTIFPASLRKKLPVNSWVNSIYEWWREKYSEAGKQWTLKVYQTCMQFMNAPECSKREWNSGPSPFLSPQTSHNL